MERSRSQRKSMEIADAIEEFYNENKDDIIKRFCVTTSAHGWSHIPRHGSGVMKFVWITIILVALTANVLHATVLIMQFFTFPTEIKTDIEMAQLDFPSITICNINPQSASTKAVYLQNTSTKYYSWHNFTEHFLPYIAKILNKSEEYQLIRDRLKQPIGFFENIGEEAQQVGHQGGDFILDCAFGVHICTKKNFTLFQTPTYFNCYTFNNAAVTRDLAVRSTGPQEGLSLVLYLENDNGNSSMDEEYYRFQKIGNAAGIRVVVHAPHTRPSPVDHGFDIAPGLSANIGLAIKARSRLNSPYGTCTETKKLLAGGGFNYDFHSCIILCQQAYVMEKCSCISSLLLINEREIQGWKYCAQLTGYTEEHFRWFFGNMTCEAETLESFLRPEFHWEGCECHPGCMEYSYDPDVSYSAWPMDQTQQSFYHAFVMQHPQRDALKAYQNFQYLNVSEIVQQDLVAKNFVRVNVYMRSLETEEHIQHRSYGISNLFSDLGGTFGLWIGMSLITWCEVGEMLIQLIHEKCKHQKKHTFSEPTDNADIPY